MTLLVVIAEAVIGHFTTATLDTIGEWWKATPAEDAIRLTADHFRGQYDGLGPQLGDWAKHPAVGGALYDVSHSRRPAADVAKQLLDVLGEVGFQAAPPSASAEEVLSTFFRKYHEAHLATEGSTYSTGHIVGQLRDTEERLSTQMKQGFDRLETRVPPALPSPTSPALLQPGQSAEDLPPQLKTAKALITQRQPAAALKALKVIETEDWSDLPLLARYELRAATGNALMQMNDFAKAEAAFRAALELRPTRANALANVGMSLLAQGQIDDADAFAERALGLEKSNTSALQVKTQILANRGQVAEAAALAEALPSDQVSHEIRAFLAAKRGNSKEAAVHLQAAHEADESNPWILAKLAHARLLVIQEVLAETEHGPWGNLPSEIQPQIDQARSLLDQAILALSKTDSKQELSQSYFDRAVFRAFLGITSAGDDFDQGLALDPDNPTAVQHAASYWTIHGHHQKALAAIRRLRQAGRSSPTLDMLYGRTLLLTRNLAEVLRVLDAVSPETPEQERDLRLIRYEAAIVAHDWTQAESLLASIPDTERMQWKVAALSAEFLDGKGDSGAAVALLRQALAANASKDAWRLRIPLAGYFMKLGQWDEAANEFSGVVTEHSPDNLLRQYASALYNADRVSECLGFCARVRSIRGSVPRIAEIEAIALAALGNLTESDSIYEQLQKSEPDDPVWRLRRASLAIRQGDRPRAVTLLPTTDEVTKLDWDDGMQLAGMQSVTGDLMGSLETGYRVARAHPREPDAQLRYVGVFFAADAQVEENLRREVAGPGTWVTLEANGQKDVHELLESPEEPHAGTQHLNDEFANRVSGKKVGDAVTFVEDALGTEIATVAEIRSKYVGLFQDIVANFTKRFPGAEGLRGFTVSPDDDFAPIKRSLERRAAFVDQTLEQYMSAPMPLTMLGKAIGVSDLEIWEALAGWQAGRPVIVGLGTPEALQAYTDLANATSPLVLEATSLWALSRLGALDAVARLGRELLVARSVVDDLEELRTQREMDLRRPGEHTTLLVKDGELMRQTTTREDIQLGLARLVSLVDWIRAHCHVSPVTPGPEHHRRTLLQGLSRGSYDSIICAHEHDAVLVCEDLRLRSFAETEFKRPGLASVHLLGGLTTRGLITTDRYDEMMATVAQWNYKFVSISHGALLAAFRLDSYTVGPRVQGVLNRLSDAAADAGPVVVVVTEALREIVLQPVLGPHRQVLLHGILRSLAARSDWSRVERALFLRLQARLNLHPLAAQTLRLEIQAWKRAHLLP